MTRRRLALLGVAAVAVGAGLWIGWSAMARQFEASVAAWSEQQRQAGFEVAHGPVAVGGFPAVWRAEVPAPRIGLAREGGWRWDGPDLKVVLRSWEPGRLRIEASGAHELSFALPAGPALAEARLLAAEAELWRDAEGGHLVAQVAGAEARVAALGVAAALAEASLTATERPDALHVVVAARRLDLPAEADGPLGGSLAVIDLEFEVRGPLEPAGGTGAALARWRDAGGTLEVRRLRIEWGPLTLVAEGTLGLDAELRMQGLLMARVRGLGEAVARFEAAGRVARNRATALKVAAALLTQPNGEGVPEAELPVTFQGGWVALGPLQLLALPPLAP